MTLCQKQPMPKVFFIFALSRKTNFATEYLVRPLHALGGILSAQERVPFITLSNIYRSKRPRKAFSKVLLCEAKYLGSFKSFRSAREVWQRKSRPTPSLSSFCFLSFAIIWCYNGKLIFMRSDSFFRESNEREVRQWSNMFWTQREFVAQWGVLRRDWI